MHRLVWVYWSGTGKNLFQPKIDLFAFTCILLSPRFWKKWWGYCEDIHPSVHQSVIHQSICSSDVCPSSIHLLIMLSLPKALGGIQPNLLHHFPLMVRLCMSNIIFPWVCSSGYLLLNYWVEFNQTFHLMVRLCESNSIFPCVHPPTICQSCYLLLNHCANLTKLAT